MARNSISNVVKSWDLQGVMDNGMDFIDQIVPVDTPFYNELAKVMHRSGSFKWTTDTNDGDVIGHVLGTNVAGGRKEVMNTDDVPANSSENISVGNQQETLNYTQIFRKFVKVSKSAGTAAVHGRVNETVYQLAKATDALKNQIEGTFMSGQVKQAADDNNAAKTDGISAQIPAQMGIAGDINAANVADMCDRLFKNGSNADTIYCNRSGAEAIKHLMDVGDKVGRPLQWMEEGKEHNTFTDKNGRLYKVVTHRHLDEISPNEDIAIFLNHDDFQAVVFRDWNIAKLDTRGSYDEYMISCEVGLRHSGKFKAGQIVKS